MGTFTRYLHFMKGSSIPQEKREVSTNRDLAQDCRKDRSANTEKRYFTFIKLPCARRSHKSFDDLTKAMKMTQKCSQKGQHRQEIEMCWDNTLPQKIHYIYLLLQKLISQLQRKCFIGISLSYISLICYFNR